MRITIDIDENQLAELQKATGESKKSPAIRRALAEFVIEKRRKEFLRRVLAGGSDYRTTNEELEAQGTYDAD